MTVRITLEGSAELRVALRALGDEIAEAVSDAVVGTALELQTDVKQRIQSGPASGRVYQKYNPRRTHQSSAPGEAPMSDTGRLASSITFDTEGPLTATVGSALVYASWLEYGTTQMAPRPFFTPAVEDIRPKFNKRLEAAIARATK